MVKIRRVKGIIQIGREFMAVEYWWGICICSSICINGNMYFNLELNFREHIDCHNGEYIVKMRSVCFREKQILGILLFLSDPWHDYIFLLEFHFNLYIILFSINQREECSLIFDFWTPMERRSRGETKSSVEFLF